MIRVDIGTPYECCRFRSGASDKGRWEIVSIIEEGKYGKNRQEITIFPANLPSGVKEGQQFIIKRILSVARKKGKDKDGNWTRVDVNITAEIEPVKAELNLDGDLPFTMGAYDKEEDEDENIDIRALLGSDEPTDLL